MICIEERDVTQTRYGFTRLGATELATLFTTVPANTVRDVRRAEPQRRPEYLISRCRRCDKETVWLAPGGRADVCEEANMPAGFPARARQRHPVPRGLQSPYLIHGSHTKARLQ